MASNDINNYWGPFTTKAEAIETVVFYCGEGIGVIWEKDGEFWSNDGTDGNTGKPWITLPEGARFMEMREADVMQVN